MGKCYICKGLGWYLIDTVTGGIKIKRCDTCGMFRLDKEAIDAARPVLYMALTVERKKKKTYEVKIIQRGEMDVEVVANSSAEAMQFVDQQFSDGNILMTDEHWEDIRYQVKEIK